MILLTHNMLASPMKEAAKQLPLGIEAVEVREIEREFNPEFLRNMIDRLDWSALVAAATTLKASEGLPATVEGLDTGDDDALKRLHHVLLEVDVVTGSLVCTETGRKFPIAAGIPNMLLNQDEI